MTDPGKSELTLGVAGGVHFGQKHLFLGHLSGFLPCRGREAQPARLPVGSPECSDAGRGAFSRSARVRVVAFGRFSFSFLRAGTVLPGLAALRRPDTSRVTFKMSKMSKIRVESLSRCPGRPRGPRRPRQQQQASKQNGSTVLGRPIFPFTWTTTRIHP